MCYASGFHADSLFVTQFSREYARTHMLAYVNMVQRAEAKHKVETLTHQMWSGAELIDTMLSTITGGLASTAAMGTGNVSAPRTFRTLRVLLCSAKRLQPRSTESMSTGSHGLYSAVLCVVLLQTEAQFKSVTKKKTEEQFQQLLD